MLLNIGKFNNELIKILCMWVSKEKEWSCQGRAQTKDWKPCENCVCVYVHAQVDAGMEGSLQSHTLWVCAHAHVGACAYLCMCILLSFRVIKS